jgi:signal transduction histidine kinase
MASRTRSITRQTVTIVLLAQIAFAIALAGVSVLSERHARMRALSQQIAGRSDSLLGAIQDAEDPEDNIFIDPAELRLPPEDRYAVYSDTKKLIGRSAEAGPPLSMDGALGESNVRMDGESFSVLRRTAMRIIDRAEYGGIGLRRPVVIVYASSERHVLHEVLEAVGRFLAAIVLASMVVALITALLLRRTLQPIRHLALAAQRISPASLQFEIPYGALQVEELRPLATTLSALIDELREAFAKEQRFVGDAAHELKTAVAVVRSSMQVLMMRRRNEEEYVLGLEQLLEDNARVEDLVASMLELARVEQISVGDADLVDLAVAARQACDTMQSFAENQAVTLTVEAPPEAFTRLHPEGADTLLTNLLSNAIRHSKPGATVRVAILRNIDATIRVVVADDGQGIRPEALPHVFERFYRDDPSRSRMSGGTGLGLAICRSIVESVGGTIEIASVLGQGTTVTVIFSGA